MANIAVSNDWPAGVYQYADGDVLDGGDASSEVLPIKQLANRSLFQRLANVTPWDSALATEFGYPNKAVVMHGGQSWRAKIANDVEPGTDATKWERWGFSQSELDQQMTSVKVYTDAEREQAQANIALPVEYFQVLSASAVTLPANTTAVQLSLTGGTETIDGSIQRVGHLIKINKAGLYAVSATLNLLTAGVGFPAILFRGYVNGTLVQLLTSAVQDKTTLGEVGQGYRTAFSGVIRLEVDDTVGFYAYQHTGAVIPMTANLSGASVTRLAI